MSVKHVTFPFENIQLSGAIHYPNPINNNPTIVLVHGFTGSKVGEHRLFVKAARYFSEHGYTVFRFDFSGCGESDGDYSGVTVSSQIKQLQTALDFVSIQQEVDSNNITVIGHSLGGAVSSLTAAIDERVKELVLWSPVARPYKDITKITGLNAVKVALENGKYDYHGFYLSHGFFQDLKYHAPLTAIKSYSGDVLILHAEQDQDVPKENGKDYDHALKQRTSNANSDLYYLTDADHTFSSYSFEEQLFTKTFNWLFRCQAPKTDGAWHLRSFRMSLYCK
jgi:pimeloyl-ACP methyl ester carboxylesterase